MIPDSESKTNTSTSSDQESDNGKTSDDTDKTVIENTEVIKTKDYDKNNSANTTITTDDTTANREGETESVYKEEGTTTPTATVSRTGSSSPIQAMRSKLKPLYRKSLDSTNLWESKIPC